MKKIFILLSFCSLFLFGCPASQEMDTFKKIDYSAITRGSSKQITLENGEFTRLQNNKETIRKKLDKKMYNSLFKILKEIDLSSLETLTVPSKKHQYDGALASTITIESEGKTYTSPTFDDDNPPTELKKLIDYLQSITK